VTGNSLDNLLRKEAAPECPSWRSSERFLNCGHYQLCSSVCAQVFRTSPQRLTKEPVCGDQHLADDAHTQDGAPTMPDNGSACTDREKALPAKLRRWRRVRRTAKLTHQPLLKHDGVVLDRVRQRVQVHGQIVDLSAYPAWA